MKSIKKRIPSSFYERYKKYSLVCKREKQKNGFVFKQTSDEDKLEPLVLHKWKESCIHIPLISTVKGRGSGEERLAFILDGTLAGSGVSYDIIVQDKKYEVKFLENYSSQILAGISGVIAMQNIRNKTLEIVERIISISDPKILSNFDECEIAMIDYFKSNAKGLLSGTFRFHTVAALELVLIMIRDVKKKMQLHDKCRMIQEDWELDKNLQIDSRTHIKVTRQLNKNFEYSALELFDEYFDDVAFENCEDIVRYIADGPKPSTVFSDVDGLLLAFKDGYVHIPKNMIDTCLFYAWTGQGPRPNFKINKSAF